MAADAVAEDPARSRTSGGRRDGASTGSRSLMTASRRATELQPRMVARGGARATAAGGADGGLWTADRGRAAAAWQLRWPAAAARCGGGPGRQRSAAATPAATPTADNGDGCDCGGGVISATTPAAAWRDGSAAATR
ncbi:hypothetical protein Scep_023866 [Stephania cephalantha]|uniref:Uncharacterized protein n=1 Tax=Stephania cephalantha TaxID=152367 RepID=A0AAP0EWK0_9MAGN